jgi:PadR family transcriptional regulator
MGKSDSPTLLQGTLDLLVLHALQRGALHGYAIAQTIHLLSELDGAIRAHWGVSENNRRAKYYEITPRGRKVLAAHHETWTRLSSAVGRVLAR